MKTRTTTLIVVAALLALAPLVHAAGTARPAKGLRVLFVGNSYTYDVSPVWPGQMPGGDCPSNVIRLTIRPRPNGKEN